MSKKGKTKKPVQDAAQTSQARTSQAPTPKGSKPEGLPADPEWARGLKKLYDSVVDEPLPDSFTDLLSQLDDSEQE